MLFQYEAHELIGLPVEWLIPKRFAHEHRGLRRHYFASGMPSRAMGAGRELSALRRDGTEFPAEIALSAISWNDQACVAVSVRDVSERRGSMEALRRAHREMGALVAASPMAIIACDVAGRVREWNPAAVRLFHISRKQALGIVLRDLLGHGGAALASLVDRLLVGAPAANNLPLQFLRFPDPPLELRVSSAHLGDESDESGERGVLLLVADESARMRTDRQNQLYHEIALAIRAADSARSALRVAIARVCDALGWVCANAWRPNAQQLLEPTDVLCVNGEPLPEFEQWARTTVLPAGLNAPRLAFTERRVVWIHDMRDLEGEPCAVMARTCQLRTALALPVMAGNQVLAVLTFYSRERRERDESLEHLLESVTAQLGDALDRHRAADALTEHERQLRIIVDGAPFGIALLDAAGTILSANPALCAFLHCGAGTRLEGRSFTTLLAAGDDESAAVAARVLQLPDDQASSSKHRQVTMTFHAGDARDEQVVHGRCHVAHLRERGNHGERTVVMIEDVSMQLEAEARMKRNEALMQESQRLEAIGRLAGGIAHDFNNLLAATASTVEILLTGDRLDAEDRAQIATIGETAAHGARLTRQLLAYAKRQMLQPSLVDVVDVIRHMTPMLSRLIGPNTTLDVRLPDSCGLIVADATQLEQAVINLVINARDAMPAGGVVRVHCHDLVVTESTTEVPVVPGHYLCIEVHDNGVGIDPAVRAHIFEPFFTTKQMGEGTGLGLATVHGIVTQSGGMVDVVSAPGEGATFRMFFPVAEGAVAGDERAYPAPSSGVPLPPGLRVLLVDDQPAVLRATTRVLEHLGCHVTSCLDGRDALDHADREHFDVLLTDVSMPEMGGIELARRIRERHPHLPVLFMSGYSDEALRFPDDQPGSIVSKPFTSDELGQHLRAVLASSR